MCGVGCISRVCVVGCVVSGVCEVSWDVWCVSGVCHWGLGCVESVGCVLWGAVGCCCRMSVQYVRSGCVCCGVYSVWSGVSGVSMECVLWGVSGVWGVSVGCVEYQCGVSVGCLGCMMILRSHWSMPGVGCVLWVVTVGECCRVYSLWCGLCGVSVGCVLYYA